MSPASLSLAAESRQSDLDAALSAAEINDATPGEVFAVVDAISASSALRRALTDPGSPAEAKAGLVQQLFGGRVSAQVVRLLTRATDLRWASATALLTALERQGVRAALSTALNRGTLDNVSDELFRFNRLAQSDASLQAALSDDRTPAAGRAALVTDLLSGKADPVTVQLAQRAVEQKGQTFAGAVDSMLNTAAQLRDRGVAKVTVARALDDAQQQRLSAALTRIAGRPVEMQIDVDPQVIGGARVLLGDQVIEGTVSHKLTELSRHFG